MADISILIEGYYHDGTPVRAVATTTLVRGDNFIWVVDPGSAPAHELVAALAGKGLVPGDVDTVFLTHSHLDHLRNTGLFTAARVLNAEGWWEGDAWREFDEVLPAGLSILPTPGHSADLLTLLVDTPDGRVAICGDVVYSEALLDAADPFADDAALVAESRARLLSIADMIVPGHGGAFATRRK